MTKTKIALIALAMCCIALLAAGTVAYFTVEDTAYNVITTANLDMELVEETTGGLPFPEEGIGGVMPGNVVDKKVYVQNTDGVDFWTRIKLAAKITLADGTVIEPAMEELSKYFISLDLNTEKWVLQDGWYYCTDIVTAGSASPELMNTVTFDKLMPNEYQNCTVELDVKAQAVQSKHNGATVLEAAGWPEE